MKIRKNKRVAMTAIVALAIGLLAVRAGYPMWTQLRADKNEAAIERDEQGIRVGMQSFAVGEGGVALVLVHGFASGPAVFRPMAPALAEAGFDCRAIRLPGFGETLERMANISEVAWRKAVSDAVEDARREGKRVWLVGHSMGGTLALEYALAHRKNIEGLVLMAPLIEVSSQRSLGLPPEFLQRVADCALPRDTVLETAFPVDLNAQADGILELRDRYLPISMYDAMFRVAAGVRGRGAEIDLPVLMVVPGADKVVSRRASLRYFETLAASRKELMDSPKAGHVVPLDYGWEDVASRVKEFVGVSGADSLEENRL